MSKLTEITLSKYDYNYAASYCLYGSACLPFPDPNPKNCSAWRIDFDEEVPSLDDIPRRHAVLIVTQHPTFGATVGVWAADESGELLTDAIEAWEPMDYARVLSDGGNAARRDIADNYLADVDLR